jgi:hypothetical protein
MFESFLARSMHDSQLQGTSFISVNVTKGKQIYRIMWQWYVERSRMTCVCLVSGHDLPKSKHSARPCEMPR